MIGYRFLFPAEEEMTEASLFYEGASEGLGSDFLDDVQHAINMIRTQPLIGRDIGDGLRRVLLSKFPFNLIYTIASNEVVITAVAHQRRRPDYWRDRI
jgi:toxin ParE1/3/4